MILVLSVLPIVLIIFCGYILVRMNVLPSSDWKGIETLSFRLLIPAMLIKHISAADLAVSEFAPMNFALISTLTLVGLGVLTLRWFRDKSELPNPSLSTIFQTTTRWNAFITLVAVELFIGDEGILLVVIAMAVLIPLINISNISILAIYGTAKATPFNVMKQVLKNPIVQACVIGISINMMDIVLHNTIIQTLDLIARAAIGIGLLAVGAGINPARLFKSSLNMWLGVGLRLLVCPLLFLLIAYSLGLSQLETLVGVLILAAPSASHGYIAAKQMGGNSELYADILAWQIVISMLLLPVYVLLIVG